MANFWNCLLQFTDRICWSINSINSFSNISNIIVIAGWRYPTQATEQQFSLDPLSETELKRIISVSEIMSFFMTIYFAVFSKIVLRASLIDVDVDVDVVGVIISFSNSYDLFHICDWWIRCSKQHSTNIFHEQLFFTLLYQFTLFKSDNKFTVFISINLFLSLSFSLYLNNVFFSIVSLQIKTRQFNTSFQDKHKFINLFAFWKYYLSAFIIN